jgi:hypothetical protein
MQFETAPAVANKKSRDYATQLKPFRGSNLFGSLAPKGYVVTSFATPVLVHYEGNWYETETKYSPTTSKQLGQVRPYENWSRVPQAEFDKMLSKVLTTGKSAKTTAPLPSTIAQHKKELVEKIMGLASPFMWESNMPKTTDVNDREPGLRIYLFPKKKVDGDLDYVSHLAGELQTSGMEDGFIGFTERGDFITDFYMAMVVQPLISLCLEDLLAVEAYLSKNQKKLFVKQY